MGHILRVEPEAAEGLIRDEKNEKMEWAASMMMLLTEMQRLEGPLTESLVIKS